MSKYIKLFETHSEYNTYISGQDAILPNVSYCEDNNDVHYNPWTDPRLIITFNVEDDSELTQIYGGMDCCEISVLDNFSNIEVDGVEISLTDLDENYGDYQLSNGIHTIKYTLLDPTEIGESAFSDCYNITTVTIPNTVTTIGSHTFDACTSLTKVKIPDSVTTIGGSAFSGCESLTKVKMPDSVTTIGSSAFSGCTNLTSITISNNITSISAAVFNGCTSLISVTIPNNVTSIGNSALRNCSSLTSVIIGNSVTSISLGVFINCSSLTNITSLATTAPTISNSTFQDIKTNGTLTVPTGSTGYDVWMGTGNYYLGKYNWTKVEQ